MPTNQTDVNYLSYWFAHASQQQPVALAPSQKVNAHRVPCALAVAVKDRVADLRVLSFEALDVGLQCGLVHSEGRARDDHAPHHLYKLAKTVIVGRSGDGDMEREAGARGRAPAPSAGV